ncbi:hypothetical protein X756_12905 [Mesorhizobium sp. LSHC412B00]|nr:hypothetical protein X756_12905 [Mesorhizobium sp. LSHC412B00]
MEGLRHDRQPEHRQRQPDGLADPHGEQERKHVTKALRDDAGNQCRDRWAGRAGGNEESGGEDQQRGEVHGGAFERWMANDIRSVAIWHPSA